MEMSKEPSIGSKLAHKQVYFYKNPSNINNQYTTRRHKLHEQFINHVILFKSLFTKTCSFYLSKNSPICAFKAEIIRLYSKKPSYWFVLKLFFDHVLLTWRKKALFPL